MGLLCKLFFRFFCAGNLNGYFRVFFLLSRGYNVITDITKNPSKLNLKIAFELFGNRPGFL
jgi:hypothetical protein